MKFHFFFPLYTALFLFSSCTFFSKTKKSTLQKPYKNVQIDISTPGMAYGPCEPSIFINPRNTKNIVAGSVLDTYYWSEDGGLTWGKNKLTSSLGVYGDPVLVADYQNNIFYAHLSDVENKGWASEKMLDRIVIQRSTDGGKTYNDGSYTGANHPKDQDKHWLSVDPKTNTLYCSWTEFDKYDSKKESDKSRILFSKSEDAGDTWTEAIAISQFEGDCLDSDYTTEGAVPAAGPNGEVYVAWAWNNKIWFDRSKDGGTTWQQEDIVIANQPGGWDIEVEGIQRCNGMPILVCDLSDGPNRGTLYCNWSDQRNGSSDTDIWLSKSTDGGTTWSAPKRVNDDKAGKQQFFTWMAIDQTTGYLYCVFYDRRHYDDLQTDVYMAVSKDGGDSFENVKISTSPFTPVSYIFFGDYNCISAHDGVVRPIWTRYADGKFSIMTALIQD